MKKKSSGWFCKECGYESISYLGRCPVCSSWGSFTEQPQSSIAKKDNENNKNKRKIDGHAGHSKKLSEINNKEQESRLSTGYEELDRVLGGGLHSGSFILLGGDPGIGKSTLLLQVMGNFSMQNIKVLYVSGEESENQIKTRAQRLNVDENLLFFAETELEIILDEIDKIEPEILVIDSIQTLYSSEINSFPGSPSQIRHCGNLLMQVAKKRNLSIITIGHITKDGIIAGPKILEHMVDVVLYFEGDKQNYFRMIRGIKNRFGATDEIGIFEMTESGLLEVSNPSSLFLSNLTSSDSNDPSDRIGTVVTAVNQGSRILLAEIQALAGYTSYAQPKRMVNGLDFNRANQVIAVLERRIGLNLSKQDVYASVVGGLNIDEPASDLALCLAIVGCSKNLSVHEGLIAFGEIGLSGELRTVSKMEARLREASRLGFKLAIIPRSVTLEKTLEKLLDKKQKLGDMKIHTVTKLSDALHVAFKRTN